LDKEEVAYRIAPFYNTLINRVKKYLPVAKEVIKRVANVDEARQIVQAAYPYFWNSTTNNNHNTTSTATTNCRITIPFVKTYELYSHKVNNSPVKVEQTNFIDGMKGDILSYYNDPLQHTIMQHKDRGNTDPVEPK